MKEEEKEIADQDLIDGKKVLDELKAKRDQLFEQDKIFEKNFKKEFPGLGFNQLEALMKSFRYYEIGTLFWIIFPTKYLVGCVIQKRNWFFRKRPKGAPGGVDAKAFTISGKDARQDSLGYNGKPKDGGLKTKSIAAALERVCILNIFFLKIYIEWMSNVHICKLKNYASLF